MSLVSLFHVAVSLRTGESVYCPARNFGRKFFTIKADRWERNEKFPVFHIIITAVNDVLRKISSGYRRFFEKFPPINYHVCLRKITVDSETPQSQQKLADNFLAPVVQQ